MINLNIETSKNEELQNALIAFLKDFNFDVNYHPCGDHVVMIATAQSAQVSTPAIDTNITPPVEVENPAASEVPGSVVPVEIPMGTIGGPELTVAISPSDAIAAAAEPEPITQAQPSLSGDVILKNLSTVCSIPFCIDASLPCSELKVQKLTTIGDQVAFMYCSMSFKFPIEKPEAQSVICNSNPQFTDTSIRAVACIAGKDDIPVLLKLVDGDECCVVFGQDVAGALSHSQEKIENGSLPTQ